MDTDKQNAPLHAYDVGPCLAPETTNGYGNPPIVQRRLHLNEFRYEHAPGVLKTLKEITKKYTPETLLTYYPTGTPPGLQAAIAKYIGAPSPDNIIMSAGSDEVLRAVVDLAVHRKLDTVLLGTPTYSHFKLFATSRNLKLCTYSLGISSSEEERIAAMQYYEELLKKGTLVYLGNPNNPTGGIYKKESISRLSKEYPTSLFLVDEAYIEFAECESKAHSISSVSVALDRPNVIVTRTFSKALGLAALRIGYAVGKSNILKEISAGVSPKSVGHLAAQCAMAALREEAYYLTAARKVRKEHENTVKLLSDSGWKVTGTSANFFLLYVGDTKGVIKHLANQNIHIRDRSSFPELFGYVRITVGSSDDMKALVSALSDIKPPQHAPIQGRYTPKGHITSLKIMLRKVSFILDKVQVKYWLTDGSLLGAERHKGIIPWDDDIDLGFIQGSLEEKITKIRTLLTDEGLIIQRNRTNAYWQVGDNKYDMKISPVHIDLFSYAKDEKGFYRNLDPRFQIVEPTSGNCNLVCTENELFPLKYLPFYDLSLPVPHKSATILDRALGKEWRTIALIRGNIEFPETRQVTIADYTPA